ncbi:nucleoside-diphosphate-sugar epimerase [Sulfitobacter undariae]|uniref:Nucleoside-diphosphate-sugar epimerase n=1 Tax=Sulfitobacter undariae TaxID=1563671 RepID=A0A7W6GZE9_9RHOB|nr:NAD-dependent epimerase/dehydratase family protein [Sulfitobacter undariae]MBB3993440.1 nucleoside-diphosphate-sugar epimerase [Sulfitobacter undariae]
MTKTVLILGANGRFGRAATQAFSDAGWNVRAATRTAQGAAMPRVSRVACDVTVRAAVISAAQGVDVIVHAANPIYPQWAQLVPTHTANIIAAGLASGATVMIPGNVYNFGENADVVLNEANAFAPTTKKGALRVTMERCFEDAAQQGLRTIILRGGDYLEREKSGNWFDSQIGNKAHRGKFTYPGSMDVVHAWAYLPDMARAMVGLAEKRDTFAPFVSFGFEGYSLTGTQLKDAVAQAVGRSLTVGQIPWWLLRVMSVFSPMMREVLEMRYLWNTPHRVDGSALHATLPDFIPTPLAEAMADVMAPSRSA